MAYGWILDSMDGQTIIASGNRTCGFGSSNISEYRALIAGLQGSLKANVDIIHIIGDSQLIIQQVLGSIRANKQSLKEHRDYVVTILNRFDDWTIKWVPRHQNKRADALVNQVFDRKWPKCKMKKKKP